jgi:CHASE3 domain sensor protein
MTVRLRLLVVLATMSLMAIVAMTVPFVATSRLLDDLKGSTSFSLQASAAYARLAQSLGEQETALSGYILTGNETYLDQYYNGAAAEQLAYESIEGTIDGVDAIDQGFDRVRQSMTEWRAVYAAPTIDDVWFD